MAAITLDAAHHNEQSLSPGPPLRSSATVAQEDRSAILPADPGATVGAPFGPLDPDVVSEVIPAFFIGRNGDGFWVARDVNVRIGGIFLFENSALSFARKHSGAAGCATVYLSERFELDLENRGNPLVVQLAALVGYANHARQRCAALLGRMAAVAGRSARAS